MAGLLLILGISIYSKLPTFIAIDPKIQPWVNEVSVISKGNLGKNVRGIGMKTFVTKRTIGKCFMFWREIHIDSTFWRYANYRYYDKHHRH